MTAPTTPLEMLIEQVQASPKYRHVSPDLIRRLGGRELSVRRSLKDAVKETRNKLHQIAGAFLESRPRYTEWLGELTAGRQEGDDAFRATCLRVMAAHASTRERLPILPEIYMRTLGGLPPIRSLLDVGCGLNPLALSWMPLAPDAVYHACDIHADLISFLQDYFALTPICGRASVCDAVGAPPGQQVDVALLMKVLPVVEQQERTASLTLLRALKAERLLVSFPTRTLGGRNRAMALNYDARFRDLIRGETWTVQRFEFAEELCFLITK